MEIKKIYLSFPDHYTAFYDYAIQGYSPLAQLCSIISAPKLPISTQQSKVMVSASIFLAFYFVLFVIYLRRHISVMHGYKLHAVHDIGMCTVLETRVQ
jgi:hypothetical protein